MSSLMLRWVRRFASYDPPTARPHYSRHSFPGTCTNSVISSVVADVLLMQDLDSRAAVCLQAAYLSC